MYVEAESQEDKDDAEARQTDEQRARTQNCNEIVMMEGSERVKSNPQATKPTKRPALQAVKESNKVEHFQNGATSPCVLIIRRSPNVLAALVANDPQQPRQSIGL